MKHIYFLRHAKAPSDVWLEDIKRPLGAEGKVQAAAIAKYALQHIKAPEIIFTSSAQRALQTALYLKEVWKISDEDFQISPLLYAFHKEEVLNFIYGLPNEYKHVMLVGHNFAFSDLVNHTANKRIGILPTAGFVEMKYDVDLWYHVDNGEILRTVFPSDLID